MKFLKRLFKFCLYIFALAVGFVAYQGYTDYSERKKEYEQKNVQTVKSPAKPEKKSQWADSLDASVSQKCHRAIESRVNNPATLDIKYFSGSASQKIEATKTIIYSVRFTAQNDFGVEKRFTAYCRGDTDGSFSFNAEQGFTN